MTRSVRWQSRSNIWLTAAQDGTVGMLGQSVFGRLAGYEDVTTAAKLEGPIEVSVGCPDENAEEYGRCLKKRG